MDLAIVLLLVILNGLLAASELAIVSARPARLRALADEGDRRAQAALDLAREPERFLSTVQIGITLIGILAGAFGGAALSGTVAGWLRAGGLGDRWADPLSVVRVVGLITYLSLVIGELAPKRLALLAPEAIALRAARPMTVLARFSAPAVTVLARSSDLVLRLLGARGSDDPPVTEEEVELLLQEGARHGVFAEAERALAQGVLDLGDRNAGELMTPRLRVTVLDLTLPEEENRRRIAQSPYSAYPVCEGSLDRVAGMVTLRALWEQAAAGGPLDLRSAMTPPLFVPERAPVLRVLEQFRATGNHRALVVDEYGGVEGILTMEDLLGAIAGDLDLARDGQGANAIRRADGSWSLDGALPAHEARELLAIETLPGEDDGEFETLAGFLLARLGRIPDPGDHVDWDGWRFTVAERQGNRVARVTAAREG
ncbi:MAG: hemolysin family protein [Chloroflexota bacterium]